MKCDECGCEILERFKKDCVFLTALGIAYWCPEHWPAHFREKILGHEDMGEVTHTPDMIENVISMVNCREKS
ncbi:MAG: hypothetical protein KC483_10850 [Nitrosarchaeum sp.]|nr:hypothetical protein [Nitrosarchaeum sp.]